MCRFPRPFSTQRFLPVIGMPIAYPRGDLRIIVNPDKQPQALWYHHADSAKRRLAGNAEWGIYIPYWQFGPPWTIE